MRTTTGSLKTLIAHDAKVDNRSHVQKGRLAEDYDGIGQTVAVAFSEGSTGVSMRAKISPADATTGTLVPAGTEVTLYVNRGLVTVLSLGYR